MASKGSPSLKQFTNQLLHVDAAYKKEGDKEARANKRNALGLRVAPCFKVVVCQGGNIKVKEGNEPWQVITPKKIKEDRPI